MGVGVDFQKSQLMPKMVMLTLNINVISGRRQSIMHTLQAMKLR